MYIADEGDNTVYQVAATNGHMTAVTLSANLSLDRPTAVAVDAKGDLFIADTGNNRVLEVPVRGRGDLSVLGAKTEAHPQGLDHPSGIAVNAQGDIYIADTDDNRIQMVSPQGTVSTAVNGLDYPTGVAVDQQGDLYIADLGHSVVVEAPSRRWSLEDDWHRTRES